MSLFLDDNAKYFTNNQPEEVPADSIYFFIDECEKDHKLIIKWRYYDGSRRKSS